MRRVVVIISLFLSLTIGIAAAAPPDPVLHEKALGYVDYIQNWASNGFGPWEDWDSIGGVCEQTYTDETLTELERLRGSGDSTIWTGMYCASQALRYMSTGEEAARDEVLRVAAYLHHVKEVTGTPGYVARFVALDEEPWNREYVGHDSKILGEGEYEGFYWVDNTSRDQYTGWWLGLSLAYEAVDDPDMRATIRADFKDVIDTLVENHWRIVDQDGIVDGNGAASVLPTLRLSWVLQAASVGADPSYWDLFDELWDNWAWYLWLDNFTWLNTYGQYFGFNLNHNTFLQLFRLIPDRERFDYLWRMWNFSVRKWVQWTHNAWFDSVYLAGCHRGGMCEAPEIEDIGADIVNTLTIFQEAPNQAFNRTPPELPLDPFSVIMDQLQEWLPFLEDIFGISVRTKEPHDFENRCWSDMIWQRTPYHISCSEQPANRVGPGTDYSIAYWTAFYYGAVPSDGPYGDDDLGDDDDDTTDDDTTDDDTAGDDDTIDDDDDADDDSVDDDDDAVGDDDDTDDGVNDTDDDDDDDNDDSGCGL
ncbi:MAG: hypothetical protein P9L99_12275 [Candidatus Lernaella stagnicola]|nr:hypothetical protein [Candidatus Lernaella stagnicola]